MRALRVVQRGAAFATEPVWENAEFANYKSTPVLVGERVCGHSHKKRGQLFCLDAATGKTVWVSEGRQGENASILAGGGMLYALTTDADPRFGPSDLEPVEGPWCSSLEVDNAGAEPGWGFEDVTITHCW